MVTSNDPCSKCGNPGEFRPGSRQCRKCERDYSAAYNASNMDKRAEYYRSNKARIQITMPDLKRSRKAWRHAEINKIKSVPCAGCGKSFPPYIMDFDHRDPSGKRYEINYLVNKDFSWPSVLEEISKCDVVCVCCHRRKTQKNDSSDWRSRFVASLKNVPCADCGGMFHYCQMDFDHVRGEKLGGVSRMNTKEAILEEVAKCEVVCANCHRERTQRSANTNWKNTSLISRVLVPNDIQVVKPFHNLVGSMSDRDLARLIKTSYQTIFRYRKRMGINRFTPKRELPPKSWHRLLGTMTDKQLSEVTGVHKNTLFKHRTKLGLPSFRSQRNYRSSTDVP
jgi:hypothetical protein